MFFIFPLPLCNRYLREKRVCIWKFKVRHYKGSFQITLTIDTGVYCRHRTVSANDVIWYREISLFHTLPFLSYWKIYKFHLFTDVVDDWGWKHFAKCKRCTDAVNDKAKERERECAEGRKWGREGTGWCERNRWIRWCNNRFMRSVDMIFLVVRLIFSTLFTSVLVVCHAFSQAAVTNEMIPNEMSEGSQTWFWGISAIQNISVIYFITRKKQKLLFGNQFERNFTQHLRRNMFASWKICYLFFNFELIDYNDVDEEQKIGGAKLRIV